MALNGLLCADETTHSRIHRANRRRDGQAELTRGNGLPVRSMLTWHEADTAIE